MPKGGILKVVENLAIVVFVGIYWKFDLRMATLALMGWLSFLVILARFLREKLTKLQLYSWIVVMILGTITLVFDNDSFIKLKTTIINLTIAGALGISHLWGNKTIIERMLGNHIKAPQTMLRKLSFATILYLIFVIQT